MKELKKIEDIVFFTINGANIFYANRNSLFLNEKLFLSEIEDRLMELAKYNENYSLLFTNGNGYITYGYGNKQLFKLPFWCHTAVICNDIIAVYDYDYDLLTPLNNIYNIKQNLLILPEWHKGRCCVVNPYIYIYIYQQEISCINLSNSNCWQFSIAAFPNYISASFREQKADVQYIIGVYNNILWVHIGGFRLVGIDVETGKQAHYIENVVKGGEQNNFLDTQNGVLKTLSFDYYAEFDLQTLQFRKQTIIESEENIKIRASNFYEGDKHLYFCGYRNNKFDKPNTFGIFDTEKASVVWYDKTKDDLGYFYNPLQANDKLLAILDDKHNLLIYDRIENI